MWVPSNANNQRSGEPHAQRQDILGPRCQLRILAGQIRLRVPIQHPIWKIRLPFGLSSAQDVCQDITSEMFEDVKGVEVVVDDVLIWGETENMMQG